MIAPGGSFTNNLFFFFVFLGDASSFTFRSWNVTAAEEQIGKLVPCFLQPSCILPLAAENFHRATKRGLSSSQLSFHRTSFFLSYRTAANGERGEERDKKSWGLEEKERDGWTFILLLLFLFFFFLRPCPFLTDSSSEYRCGVIVIWQHSPSHHGVLIEIKLCKGHDRWGGFF